MAVLEPTRFVCKVALPSGPIKVIIRAHSRSTAKAIAMKQFPKASGVLILDQLDHSSGNG